MRAKVLVRLKASILDPQGKAVLHAAKQLGFNEITSVRVGKLIELEVNDENREQSERLVNRLSHKLLANPHMEDYEIEIDSPKESNA